MRQSYWELRGLGVDLVVAAVDTPETNLALREKYDLPFSVLADENADVARAYHALNPRSDKDWDIALISMFLIRDDAHEDGGTIAWEYVGPTSRHRVAPSRLLEEVQRAAGRSELIVPVVVPSPAQLERVVAGFQSPPLGLYRTPPQEELTEPGVLTYRDYMRELSMQSHAEVHRLTESGWTLVAVSPESDGERVTGQRYVFRRTV